MLPQHKMILLLQYLAIIEFAKWRRRQCKQMAFTRKNIIFNPNSKQHLRFRLEFCYLALGMYDTPNSSGNTSIQTMYIVLRQRVHISCTTRFNSSAFSISDMHRCTRIFIVFLTFLIMLRDGLWAGHGKVPIPFICPDT